MTPLATDGFRLNFSVEGKPTARDFNRARVVIGRSMVCDVVIASAEVSRKHAEIVRDGDGWAIQDLGTHAGTCVNREPVTRRPLHDGDQIVLAATGSEPVAITFQVLDASPKGRRRAVLCDRPELTSIRASIDLKEFERTLFEARPRRMPAARPAVSLFKQAAEVLLMSEDLDEMLQKVVGLAVDSMPGQRGFICLYDDATGAIEPKAFRAKSPERDQPFMVSRSILHEAARVREAMLVTNAGGDPRFHGAVSIQQMGIQAAMCVPLYHAGRVKGLIYVDSQRSVDEFDSRDLEMLTVLGLLVAVGITQMTLRADVTQERTIRARLSRYNSPRVVEQIISRGGKPEGEMLAEEHDVSVLFADLTGFTSVAERMPAADVIQLLNTVFERLASAVFQHDGTLDKYIGDAVMAVFGAPLIQPDHALRAVNTALLMRQLLDQCDQSRPEYRGLRLRIGINSGKAIAGDVGSPLRKEYTVIGDVVNVASRLEASLAQPNEIIIGPATYEQIKDLFECEPLPEVQLRGRQDTIRPYRVLRSAQG